MSAPSAVYVETFLAALGLTVTSGELIAYPAKLAGVDVVVLGRVLPPSNGTPGFNDSVPLAVIVTTELAEQMDLSEARS